MNSMDQIIKYHKYLNLEERKDRNVLCKNELAKIGIPAEKAQRFNAIKTTDGIIGCGMSHLSILKEARSNNYPFIMVIEDDIAIENPVLFKQKLMNLMRLETFNWDVLLLGGNLFPPYEVLNSDAYKIHKCFTTTGYIVRSHYYDTLIDCWEHALRELVKSGGKDRNWSLDCAWFPLQRRDTWLLIKPCMVYQRPDYSNIENRKTNYKDLFLNVRENK